MDVFEPWVFEGEESRFVMKMLLPNILIFLYGLTYHVFPIHLILKFEKPWPLNQCH